MQDLFFPCPLYQIEVAQTATGHQKGVVLVIEAKIASLTVITYKLLDVCKKYHI